MVLCLIRNAFSSSKEQNYTSWGMLLRLKSCAVMPQKLCGCKGKVKRLRRKRWQRITKRQITTLYEEVRKLKKLYMPMQRY